jgi:hypothetical protein
MNIVKNSLNTQVGSVRFSANTVNTPVIFKYSWSFKPIKRKYSLLFLENYYFISKA